VRGKKTKPIRLAYANLRDLFAASAMSGLVGGRVVRSDRLHENVETGNDIRRMKAGIVALAYELADAMLEGRTESGK
jgi:hypothetical protein